MNRRSFLAQLTFFVALIALVRVLWWEHFFIEENQFDLSNGAAGKDRISVLQLSDLHLRKDGWIMQRMTERVNEINPDLIVLTGDSVDHAENLPLLESLLSRINKDIRKIAILGNWEYWAKVDLKRLREIYTANNCELLVNESRILEFGSKRLCITGTDDLVAGRPDIRKAMSDAEPADIHLVLNHCPAYNKQILNYKAVNADLILSGHTHGGQVTFFGNAFYLPNGSGKYKKGWYKEDRIPVYVSRGIGTSTIPVRFGSKAEMPVFFLA